MEIALGYSRQPQTNANHHCHRIFLAMVWQWIGLLLPSRCFKLYWYHPRQSTSALERYLAALQVGPKIQPCQSDGQLAYRWTFAPTAMLPLSLDLLQSIKPVVERKFNAASADIWILAPLLNESYWCCFCALLRKHSLFLTSTIGMTICFAIWTACS